MASIDLGSGGSRRKAVDSTIPLVPFIDLLLCCVMFLLVTAVWNQLAVLSVTQQVPGEGSVDQAPVEPLRLFLQLDAAGYVLWSSAGDRLPIPKRAGEYDREELRRRVAAYRASFPTQTDITVTAEDGVTFDHIAGTLDLLSGNGFSGLTLSES